MEHLAGKPGKSAWPPTRAAELLHSWKEELGRARRAALESLLLGQRAVDCGLVGPSGWIAQSFTYTVVYYSIYYKGKEWSSFWICF